MLEKVVMDIPVLKYDKVHRQHSGLRLLKTNLLPGASFYLRGSPYIPAGIIYQ